MCLWPKKFSKVRKSQGSSNTACARNILHMSQECSTVLWAQHSEEAIKVLVFLTNAGLQCRNQSTNLQINRSFGAHGAFARGHFFFKVSSQPLLTCRRGWCNEQEGSPCDDDAPGGEETLQFVGQQKADPISGTQTILMKSETVTQ